MAQFTYTYDGLTVYEGSSAFYLTDGKREVCIGDGVDMFTSLATFEPLAVGTPGFYTAMRQWMKSDPAELRASYGFEE